MMTFAKCHVALSIAWGLIAWSLCATLALPIPEVQAQTLSVPGLTEEAPPKLNLSDCENVPYSQENCVRVLACIGRDGVWFDGQARGWDEGEVVGQLSSGEPCAGTWSSRGIMGTGFSQLSCADTMTAQVIYHTLHNETGTVEGSGIDSLGRRIQVWSGLNVLEFLEKETGKVAVLPCGTDANPADVPIS